MIFGFKFFSLRLLLLIMNGCIQLSVFAQILPAEYFKIDVTNGLSQNTILKIFQDKSGFMWFCTRDGLNRFDGKNIVNYNNSLEDINTLNDNDIYSLCEDNNGNLYIGTDAGFNIYYSASQKFKRFYRDTTQSLTIPGHKVFALLIDSYNRLWIGTENGIGLFDTETEKFVKLADVFQNPGMFDGKVITDLHLGQNKKIYIGTYNFGLFCFNQQSKSFKNHSIDSRVKFAYNNNTINRIYTERDNVWLCTNNGLAKLNETNGKITQYLNIPEPGVLSKSITFLSFLKISDGRLFAGSSDYGLYYYNPIKDEFLPYSIIGGESGKLSGSSYLSMCEDYSGNLWLGTRNNGVLRINLRKKPFYHIEHIKNSSNSIIDNNIFSLFEDSNHNIWIGTLQGISIWNRSQNVFHHLRPDKSNSNSLIDNRVWTIFEDNDHVFWIGTSGGMNSYNQASGRFEHFYTDYVSDNRISDNEVFAIKQDAQGFLWIGTAYGLSRYNKKTKTFRNFYHSEKDSTSIPGNTIWNIFIDNKERIWFATSKGFALYVPEKENFKRVKIEGLTSESISQSEVFSIYQDESGTIWLTSSSFGIAKLNPESDKAVLLDRISSVSKGNAVYSICGHNQFIWFTKSNELCRLDEATNEVVVFNSFDGVLSNEFNFPAIKTHDHWMVFGGANGLTYFQPDSIKIDTFMPPLVFTGLKINFNEILPGQEFNGYTPLKQNINLCERIELGYKDNIFSISFSSLDYKIPEKVLYAYQIEKISDQWIELGNQNSVSFSGLRPGKYLLKVKSTNSDGIWNKNHRQIQIIVHPPWYQTWLFYGLCIFLIAFIVLIAIKLRIRRLLLAKQNLEENVKKRTSEIEEQKEEIEAQKETIEIQNKELLSHTQKLEDEIEKRLIDLIIARDKAQEADKLKSAFISNMSHEIRTPLNAIMGFTELMTEYNISREEQTKYLEIIKKSSTDLLNLLNKIIDISVIESKKITFNASTFKIDVLFNKLFLEYKQKLERNDKSRIEMVLSIPEGNTLITCDEFRLKQVLNYLLNNAIKYTEQGQIKFGYTLIDSHVEFFIEDTGIGIDKEDLPGLFSRFGKLERDKKRLYRGTGLGLSISKELIEMMGGSIIVESEKGKGTRFTFTIPAQLNA